MWKDANAVGAIVAAWLGQALAIATWLIVTAVQSGEITIDTLGANEPMLAGNIVAIGSSGLIHLIFSLVRPQKYDFVSMGQIEMLEDDQRGLDPADYADELLTAARRNIQKWGWGFTIVMIIIWPVLSTPAGVFTQGYFSMWVFISISWGFVATFVIITLPIYESLDSIKGVLFAMIPCLGRLLGTTHPTKVAEPAACTAGKAQLAEEPPAVLAGEEPVSGA